MGLREKITIWYKNNFDSDWIEKDYEIPVKSSNESHAKLIVEQNAVPTILVTEKSYMFDKLDEIFSDQKMFTNQIDNQFKDQQFSCYNFDKADFDLYYDLNCAIEELIEAIRELNTKKWKQTRKQVDKSKVLEEIVDATKFLNQAILRLGYNANDFYELHKKKSQINRDRQKNGY
jgi:dimeric dUTPase (all-alpha-NTP-PPase superfamily)